MVKDIAYAILILLGIGVTIYIGFGILVAYALGCFDKDYSVTELKENFDRHKIEIYELRDYYRKIVPENLFIEIEFKNDSIINRFGTQQLNNSNKAIYLEWDLNINSEKTDSIITPLGWDRKTLRQIKEKLDKANCIGIESGEPTNIKFQRSGLGMYSFNLFDHPIHDSLKHHYNDSCRYILASDILVLEYGGGAVGSQCFYNLN